MSIHLTPARLREHILADATYADIAAEHGLTAAQVRHRAAALDMTSTKILGRHRTGRKRRLPPAEELYEHARRGLSDRAIAAIVGCTDRAIAAAFRREGYHRDPAVGWKKEAAA